MKAKGYPTAFFDMYSVTKELGAYFPDNLHPNELGHTLIAQELAKALEALIHGND